MKFKIKDISQKGNNLEVIISHKDCERQVFSFPIELAKDNQFVQEIKRILNESEKAKQISIDKTIIGKEIETTQK